MGLKQNKNEAVLDLLRNREQGLRGWLAENAPQCSARQAHLDNGTSEQAYWHHGYMMAIRDVLILLAERVTILRQRQ